MQSVNCSSYNKQPAAPPPSLELELWRYKTNSATLLNKQFLHRNSASTIFSPAHRAASRTPPVQQHPIVGREVILRVCRLAFNDLTVLLLSRIGDVGMSA